MLTRFQQCIAVVAFLLCGVSASFAASLSITPATGSKFAVQGNSMDGVAGIDLVLRYDSSLSSPKVIQGSLIPASGTLFVPNLNFAPGKIKIGIISTNQFSGSGSIAAISFDGSGSLYLDSYSLINSNGAAVNPDSAPTTPPGIPFSTPSPSPSPSSTTSTTSTTTPATTPQQTVTQNTAATAVSPIWTTLGTVTMPSDSQPPKETKVAEPAGAAVQPPTVPSATTPPAEQTATLKPEEAKNLESVKVTTYGSVVERFRAYQGEKSPAILMALFKKEIAPAIRQDPPVALSDGVASLKVVVALSSKDSKAPNFYLNGAKLVSLKMDDEADKWIIETMPQANVLNASLTILNGSEIIEFPLTVAPPIKSRAVSDADFSAFLKATGKDSDLNGDGKYDYLDDYIYTANYLVWQERSSKAEKKPQEPKK